MFLKVCSNMGEKKGEAGGLVEHKALVTATSQTVLGPPLHAVCRGNVPTEN